MNFKYVSPGRPDLAVWEGIVVLFALCYSLILVLAIAVIVLLVYVIKLKKGTGKKPFTIKRPRLIKKDPSQDMHFMDDFSPNAATKPYISAGGSAGFYENNVGKHDVNPLSTSNFSNIPQPPPLFQANFSNINKNDSRFGPQPYNNNSNNSKFY